MLWERRSPRINDRVDQVPFGDQLTSESCRHERYRDLRFLQWCVLNPPTTVRSRLGQVQPEWPR